MLEAELTEARDVLLGKELVLGEILFLVCCFIVPLWSKALGFTLTLREDLTEAADPSVSTRDLELFIGIFVAAGFFTWTGKFNTLEIAAVDLSMELFTALGLGFPVDVGLDDDIGIDLGF